LFLLVLSPPVKPFHAQLEGLHALRGLGYGVLLGEPVWVLGEQPRGEGVADTVRVPVELDPQDVAVVRRLDGGEAEGGAGHVGRHLAVDADELIRGRVHFLLDVGETPHRGSAPVSADNVFASPWLVLSDEDAWRF
jgi:hypothetical protein